MQGAKRVGLRGVKRGSKGEVGQMGQRLQRLQTSQSLQRNHFPGVPTAGTAPAAKMLQAAPATCSSSIAWRQSRPATSAARPWPRISGFDVRPVGVSQKNQVATSHRKPPLKGLVDMNLHLNDVIGSLVSRWSDNLQWQTLPHTSEPPELSSNSTVSALDSHPGRHGFCRYGCVFSLGEPQGLFGVPLMRQTHTLSSHRSPS